MKASEAQDCLDEVREAQRIVVLQLSGWLRGRSKAALDRQKDAREREDDLFKVILAGPNPTRCISYNPEAAQDYYQRKKAAKAALEQSSKQPQVEENNATT